MKLKFAKAAAGVLAVAVAASAGYAVGQVHQPHMHKALADLQDARGELNMATRDKGGHRGRAVQLVDETIGEVRAGDRFMGSVLTGQAVEIMTGAPVPEGADSVVMVEHTSRDNGRVVINGTAEAGQFINPRGCEAAAGETVVRAGKRLDYTDVAMLAAFGRPSVRVYRRPAVAIVPTGDEIVEIDHTPADFQIRDSNASSLAVQVARAGGVPHKPGGVQAAIDYLSGNA